MNSLTQKRLQEVLTYEPATGIFRWAQTLSRRAKSGAIAGSLDNGYRRIRIDKKIYQAHRLAWLYMTGNWPIEEVDHIDTDRSNNAWLNLRDVSRVINKQNRRKHQANNVLGVLGVCFDKRRSKYMAQIKDLSGSKFLGYFDDVISAESAYVEAKRTRHAGCTI